MGAGIAVFAGCMAITAGAGSIGCAAAAGAVGNLVSYGMSCGHSVHGCSVGGALITAGIGAATGVLGEGLGMLAGAAGGALIRGAGSLLGRGASEAISATASDAAVAATQDAAATAAQDAGSTGRSLIGRSCGGLSFSAGTRVLLASGKSTPISRLRVGQKVLAASTRTGRNQARPVAAVLVHHDTNLYDLTVRTASGSAVIHTTSNHAFWVPSLNKWVPAAKLRKGEALKARYGQWAVAWGGKAPANRDGWMWDLTIPRDHDFYILPTPAANSPHTYHVKAGAGASAVLVHNCSLGPSTGEPMELRWTAKAKRMCEAGTSRAGVKSIQARVFSTRRRIRMRWPMQRQTRSPGGRT